MQAVCAGHRTTLCPPGCPAWEGAAPPRPGGKCLQAAKVLPRQGFLQTFLVNSAAPSRVVSLLLWFEILKECNYFPKQPKQKLLPSSGMCEDTPYRLKKEIATALLIPTLRPGFSHHFQQLRAAWQGEAERGLVRVCEG